MVGETSGAEYPYLAISSLNARQEPALVLIAIEARS
jgi:hypothetical protein